MDEDTYDDTLTWANHHDTKKKQSGGISLTLIVFVVFLLVIIGLFVWWYISNREEIPVTQSDIIGQLGLDENTLPAVENSAAEYTRSSYVPEKLSETILDITGTHS